MLHPHHQTCANAWHSETNAQRRIRSVVLNRKDKTSIQRLQGDIGSSLLSYSDISRSFESICLQLQNHQKLWIERGTYL